MSVLRWTATDVKGGIATAIPAAMNAYSLSRSSRLVSATSWGAIARGVFVALAIQTVLLLFGLAIAGTVGDRVAETGYAFWMVIVYLVSFGIGGAVAAASSAEDKASAVAAGFMTWAVALVVSTAIGTLLATPQRAETSPLWTSLIAAILALVAAVIGGLIGASARSRTADEDDLLDHGDAMTSPMR